MRIKTGLLIVALGLAPVGSAKAARVTDPLPDIPKSPLTVEIEVVATGFNLPVQLTHAGDGSNRRFVVDRSGQIHILDQAGQTLGGPFLDVSGLGVLGADTFKAPTGFGSEFGLLGLAFHPDFATPGAAGEGRVYTYTSIFTGEPASPGMDDGYSASPHQSIIHEWAVDTNNPNLIDPATRREVLRVDQPQNNHNGGMIAFGPTDELLYIGLGDGGGRNDDHPIDGGRTAHGQDINTALGSILRIDPINAGQDAPGATVPGGRVGGNGQYIVPQSNPFFDMPVGPAVAGLDEIFAYGLRNPYRFSIDAPTDEMWIGDVGQLDIEEVNRIDLATQAGANFGWNIKEGSFGFEVDDNNRGFVNDETVFPPGLIDPIAEYDHDDGVSVLGGFVYRGQLMEGLGGKYLFAESSDRSSSNEGRLLMVDVDTGLLEELTIGLDDRRLTAFLAGTGTDEAGEFYVTGLDFGTGLGAVLKVIPAATPIPEPTSLTILVTGALTYHRRRPRPKPKN
jgi:glucose/arabinose dehydrogenase